MLDIKTIKRTIQSNLKKDYPDTSINIKWDRLKNTVFPTGLRGKCASALVTGQGYNPRKYTLIITDTYWTFR